jgi:hypothetical protein
MFTDFENSMVLTHHSFPNPSTDSLKFLLNANTFLFVLGINQQADSKTFKEWSKMFNTIRKNKKKAGEVTSFHTHSKTHNNQENVALT